MTWENILFHFSLLFFSAKEHPFGPFRERVLSWDFSFYHAHIISWKLENLVIMACGGCVYNFSIQTINFSFDSWAKLWAHTHIHSLKVVASVCVCVCWKALVIATTFFYTSSSSSFKQFFFSLLFFRTFSLSSNNKFSHLMGFTMAPGLSAFYSRPLLKFFPLPFWLLLAPHNHDSLKQLAIFSLLTLLKQLLKLLFSHFHWRASDNNLCEKLLFRRCLLRDWGKFIVYWLAR
jgi:hypothetical protein